MILNPYCELQIHNLCDIVVQELRETFFTFGQLLFDIASVLASQLFLSTSDVWVIFMEGFPEILSSVSQVISHQERYTTSSFRESIARAFMI